MVENSLDSWVEKILLNDHLTGTLLEWAAEGAHHGERGAIAIFAEQVCGLAIALRDGVKADKSPLEKNDTEGDGDTPDRTKWVINQQRIDGLLDAAETQEFVFWGKELVVSYKLPCGFTVTGSGACVDPANFDIEIGRKAAREMAAHKLWEFEGYSLQLLMHQTAEFGCSDDGGVADAAQDPLEEAAQSDPNVLELTLDFPKDMPPETLQSCLQEIAKAADALHRARGGNGLKVEKV
ncbi:MAG: Gp49 family protein [Cyanobacteria bacterium J06607_13]